jgi:hypothetical protein
MVTPEEAARDGFGSPAHRDFASVVWFTARQYAAFLMTESNVIAAVEYGRESAEQVRAWLEGRGRGVVEGGGRVWSAPRSRDGTGRPGASRRVPALG